MLGDLGQHNTTEYLVFGPIILAADHLSAATGIALTVTISKNGGAFAVPAGSVTEISNGLYRIAPNASDASTVGRLVIHATGTGCDPYEDAYDVVTVDGETLLRQGNTTVNLVFGPVLLTADHLTGATGITLTVTISKNGDTFGFPVGAVTEIAHGWYVIAANATDADTLGSLTIHATGAGCDAFEDAYDVEAAITAATGGLTFGDLYTTELDRVLGTNDSTQLFTDVRRKAAINAAQLQWCDLTECAIRQSTISCSNGIREYNLLSTVTIADGDLIRLATQGPEYHFLSSGTSTSLQCIAGPDQFPRRDISWLNQYQSGWRTSTGGTPDGWYERLDGGQRFFGLVTPPTIGSSQSGQILLPYVAKAGAMAASTDLPFTFGSVARTDLEPYQKALVHYAAYELEPLRINEQGAQTQLQVFMRYVERFRGASKPKGGQQVKLGRSYFGDVRARRIGQFATAVHADRFTG